jgi:hypothetical protein
LLVVPPRPMRLKPTIGSLECVADWACIHRKEKNVVQGRKGMTLAISIEAIQTSKT